MADTQPTQATGNRDAAQDTDANPQGRSAGGESGGGAYANPHTGEESGGTGGFMGHGGQSEIAYSGTGQGGEDDDKDVGNENAVTE